MDFVSHVLIGKLIQTASRLTSTTEKLLIITFAFLPDIPVLFIYLLLGRANNRPFWIPHNSDWTGVRQVHPWWSATWEIPHSLFFLLILIPLVVWLKWPPLTILPYLSHILSDALTHTGEWALKPLYPLPFTISGFTDAWAWPLRYMAVSWLVLALLICVLQRASLKQKAGAASP